MSRRIMLITCGASLGVGRVRGDRSSLTDFTEAAETPHNIAGPKHHPIAGEKPLQAFFSMSTISSIDLGRQWDDCALGI
jgi:hypothetical protein